MPFKFIFYGKESNRRSCEMALPKSIVANAVVLDNCDEAMKSFFEKPFWTLLLIDPSGGAYSFQDLWITQNYECKKLNVVCSKLFCWKTLKSSSVVEWFQLIHTVLWTKTRKWWYYHELFYGNLWRIVWFSWLVNPWGETASEKQIDISDFFNLVVGFMNEAFISLKKIYHLGPPQVSFDFFGNFAPEIFAHYFVKQLHAEMYFI